MEQERQYVSVTIDLPLLDHLCDRPAGPLNRQLAPQFEVEVGERVKLVIHHGVDNWGEPVRVFHLQRHSMGRADLPEEFKHGKLTTPRCIMHDRLSMCIRSRQVNLEFCHKSFKGFHIAESSDVVN